MMKISVLGCGTMGSTHARNLAKMPGVKLAGVCDIDAARSQRLADECGARAYTRWELMLEAEKPDVICVCLPTYLHKTFVLKLAERGLHVICEKPAALTVEDALEMEEVCMRNGVRLFVGHVVRFFPNYRDAAGAVRAGKIGSARMAHFKRHGSYPQGADGWFRDRSKSGGVIMDLMIHDIDYSRWLFGEVESVYARTSPESAEDMQYAQVTLRFKSGAMVNMTGFWGYPGPFTTEFEIAGDKGIIRFNSNQVQSLDLKLAQAEAGKREAVQVPQSPLRHDPYYDEVAHFIRCIRDGSEPLVTVSDACKAVEIALAAVRSARLGKPVEMEGIRP